MPIGAKQILVIDVNDVAVDNKYTCEDAYGTANASGDRRWGAMKVFEDGFTVKGENIMAEGEYKFGTLDPEDKRRIGISVKGNMTIHLYPEFARLLLDLAAWRDTTTQEGISFTGKYQTAGTEDDAGAAGYSFHDLTGLKINTASISASKDRAQVLMEAEIIGKTYIPTGDATPAITTAWTPSKNYLFVDGDVMLRTEAMTSPNIAAEGKVSAFNIDINNNLDPGSYKRDLWIDDCPSGRLVVSGAFTMRWKKRSYSDQLLYNFRYGEMLLNFKHIDATAYTVTAVQWEDFVTCNPVTAAGNFAVGDVVFLEGTDASGNLWSEVLVVKTSNISDGKVHFFTHWDGVTDPTSSPYCPFYQWWGLRGDYTTYSTGIKLSKDAMQIWLPTFAVGTNPDTGGPLNQLDQTFNFDASKPQIDGVQIPNFKQLQWMARWETDYYVNALN